MNKKSFRWFILFVMIVAAMPLVFIGAKNNRASAEYDDLVVISDEKSITAVSSSFLGTKVEGEEDAYEVLDSLSHVFGFSNSRESLRFEKEVSSISGTTYKFSQKIASICVFSGQINVSVKKNGRVTSITGKYFTDAEFDASRKISRAEALEVVKTEFDEGEPQFLEEYIFDKEEGGYIVYAFSGSKMGENIEVFVSAITGEIVYERELSSSYREQLPASGYLTSNKTHTQYVDGKQVSYDVIEYVSQSTGEKFYVLGDKERKIYMTDGQNKESDKYGYHSLYYDASSLSGLEFESDAIKAYLGLIKCYDFYADEASFGVVQNGIKNANGKTIDLIAIVHYGTNYENAGYSAPSYYSTKGYFLFGDGNVFQGTKSFIGGLDVIGHEYQHAYTNNICNFEYRGESGALDEAFSDIFGAVIEGKDLSSVGFWRMGEDIMIGNSRSFRDMANPFSTHCAADYDTYMQNLNSCMVNGRPVYNDDNDNGKIHYNCTLPTYATYLMYQEDPVFFNEYNILQLWYETLTKLSPSAGILDFCRCMMLSAEALDYSFEHKFAIEKAFASCGIPGYSGIMTWNGLSLKNLQGDGTIISPYLISSEADIASMAYLVENESEQFSGARYKLASDITINATIDWIGIGTELHPFEGVFNGNGKKITINTSSPDSQFSGLFGVVGENGYIHDLTVAGNSVETGADISGAIVKLLYGTLSACAGSINISGNKVGGLVGKIINFEGGEKIINSYAVCMLSGELVGGLAAEVETRKNLQLGIYSSAIITSSYFSGDIHAKTAGGLVGSANGVYLINNLALASISSNASEGAIVGGVIGTLKLENEDEIARGVYNYVLGNRSFVSFEGDAVKRGLLVGEIVGELLQGTTYLEGNIVKAQNGIDKYNLSCSTSVFKDEGTILSNSALYQGDFDFDNKAFYNKANFANFAGAVAFDMVSTFKVNKNAMPTFSDFEFWLDFAEYDFAGKGTEQSPYLISSAAELAGLANLIANETTNPVYSNKHFALTRDIDLSGKVWVGIGAIKRTYLNGTLAQENILGFKGTFDGRGHTISGMTTLGVYAPASVGNGYALTEFGPALFSVTAEMNESGEGATIRNLRLENVTSEGGYAAAVVSKAFGAICLESVSVMGANISSGLVAGGLIGTIAGTDSESGMTHAVSSFLECDFTGMISGKIAGAAVGYITNASRSVLSSVEVINFLARGNIYVFGNEGEEVANQATFTSLYTKPIAGSIVGITALSSLKIINSISMIDITSLTSGAYLGAYVGSSALCDMFAGTNIEIFIDGSKCMGESYYIFDKDSERSASALGAAISETLTTVKVTITSSCFDSISRYAIYYDKGRLNSQIDSAVVSSQDKLGEGDFDVYSDEYFSNERYFDLGNLWSESARKRLFLKVGFYVDGVLIGQTISVRYGEGVSAPSDEIKKAPTAAYKFTFVGWDREFDSITEDLKINAVFDQELRSYKVTYLDEKGNEISSVIQNYGTEIKQDIKAPKKQGNFFIRYNFESWGRKGDVVISDTTVTPRYRAHLTVQSYILILACIVVIAIVMFSITKLRKKRG